MAALIVPEVASLEEQVRDLREQNEELEHDLAWAESRIITLERELVAAGPMDPELGP
jgi:cell division septum initiation protein DivIVA